MFCFLKRASYDFVDRYANDWRFFYTPKHEVVPRVVAIAVRMVMAMCSIFCQIVFVSISCLVMS